jgi:hypothetical protein
LGQPTLSLNVTLLLQATQSELAALERRAGDFGAAVQVAPGATLSFWQKTTAMEGRLLCKSLGNDS